MRVLRAHGVSMLTIGQYLAPSPHHLPVERYVHPDTFAMFEREAAAMGFRTRDRPAGRSSYTRTSRRSVDGRARPLVARDYHASIRTDVTPSRTRDLKRP
jgi:lipoate synthase